MTSPRKLTRSISRPFTDLGNILRPLLHADRGVTSEAAKKLDRKRRDSGGITRSHFDQDWLPKLSLEEDVREEEEGEAAKKRGDDCDGKRLSRLEGDLSIDSKKTSLELPSLRPLSALRPPSLGGTSTSSEGDSLVTPSSKRRSTTSLPPPRPDFTGSLKKRVQPALIETAPTPPSTQRHLDRPSSRQRSLDGHGRDGSGLFDDVFSDVRPPSPNTLSHERIDENSSDGDEDRFGITEIPDSRPESSQSRPLTPQDILPHQIVTSLLQSRPPPVLRPSPYMRESLRPFTPAARSFSMANPSETTLFTWDLSHLPAPNTPREQPFRVRPLSILLPTRFLGGGRGTGLFGDQYGPIERKPERDRISKRESLRRSFSSATWSRLTRPGEESGGRTKEELDEWVAVVLSD